MKRTLYIIASFFLMLFLQGCWNAASTGAQMVYNRQSFKKNFSDQYITLQAYRAIKIKSKEFDDANIAIATFNSEVLLAGQAPHDWQRRKAEDMVRQIPDVKEVYNLVTVENPSSSITKINDTWLTAKVKSQFMATEEIDPTHIKVVSENGVVYLMGIVSAEEANAAVDIASNTYGVQRVVKVFSYMTITKKPLRV